MNDISNKSTGSLVFQVQWKYYDDEPWRLYETKSGRSTFSSTSAQDVLSSYNEEEPMTMKRIVDSFSDEWISKSVNEK